MDAEAAKKKEAEAAAAKKKEEERKKKEEEKKKLAISAIKLADNDPDQEMMNFLGTSAKKKINKK